MQVYKSVKVGLSSLKDELNGVKTILDSADVDFKGNVFYSVVLTSNYTPIIINSIIGKVITIKIIPATFDLLLPANCIGDISNFDNSKLNIVSVLCYGDNSYYLTVNN